MPQSSLITATFISINPIMILPQHPFSLLLIQLAVILLVSHFFGMLAKRMNQPVVIGEMIAGIFMGPSIVGVLLPGFQQAFFPAGSISVLEFFSQMGLLLFMFTVGVESGKFKLAKGIKTALIISQSGIIFPFAFGVLCAWALAAQYAVAGIPFHVFAIFMGLAMSITSFPILARIIQERKGTNTVFGSLILICAAIDDVTAWCLLSVGVALKTATGFTSGLQTIGYTLIYVLIMLLILKPCIRKLYIYSGQTAGISFLFPLVLMLLSSLTSELIGIHHLFGAFLAGLIIPDTGDVKQGIIVRLEDVSKTLLLPVFFVLSGMKTQIGLLHSLHDWSIFLVLLFAAILGKLIGCMLAARFTSLSWKQSFAAGTLMNARGLMELIVLNIGYSLGIISGEIFTMMVLIACTTTIMTSTLLDLLPGGRDLGTL